MDMDLMQPKSPAQLAEDARRASQDASEAAKVVAAEARATGQHAYYAARDVASDVSGIAADAAVTGRAYAKDAADTGREYARNAAATASSKINDLKSRADDFRAASTRYIAQEPVRSVAYAIAGGAALMAVLMSMARSRRY
jgi:hypothetical protein